jgi:hypothetical protein
MGKCSQCVIQRYWFTIRKDGFSTPLYNGPDLNDDPYDLICACIGNDGLV